MSPYLFVLTINVLSGFLNEAGSSGIFEYHPRCRRVGLTHVCFADDLLIFTKGNVAAVKKVKNILDIFYSFSGLKLNTSKSEFYAAWMKQEDVDQIVGSTGFKVSSLPVRYLGVPLVSRKLTLKDCEPLMKKLKDKVLHWSSKFLSFAGRLQLIQTVLYGTCAYWFRHFMLPKAVIKQIEKLCSAFLWNEKEGKVKWGQGELVQDLFSKM